MRESDDAARAAAIAAMAARLAAARNRSSRPQPLAAPMIQATYFAVADGPADPEAEDPWLDPAVWRNVLARYGRAAAVILAMSGAGFAAVLTAENPMLQRTVAAWMKPVKVPPPTITALGEAALRSEPDVTVAEIGQATLPAPGDDVQQAQALVPVAEAVAVSDPQLPALPPPQTLQPAEPPPVTIVARLSQTEASSVLVEAPVADAEASPAADALIAASGADTADAGAGPHLAELPPVTVTAILPPPSRPALAVAEPRRVPPPAHAVRRFSAAPVLAAASPARLPAAVLPPLPVHLREPRSGAPKIVSAMFTSRPASMLRGERPMLPGWLTRPAAPRRVLTVASTPRHALVMSSAPHFLSVPDAPPPAAAIATPPYAGTSYPYDSPFSRPDREAEGQSWARNE